MQNVSELTSQVVHLSQHSELRPAKETKNFNLHKDPHSQKESPRESFSHHATLSTEKKRFSPFDAPERSAKKEKTEKKESQPSSQDLVEDESLMVVTERPLKEEKPIRSSAENKGRQVKLEHADDETGESSFLEEITATEAHAPVEEKGSSDSQDDDEEGRLELQARLMDTQHTKEGSAVEGASVETLHYANAAHMQTYQDFIALVSAVYTNEKVTLVQLKMGTQLQLERTPQGLVIAVTTQDPHIQELLLSNRQKILEALKNKKIAVASFEVKIKPIHSDDNNEDSSI